MKAAAMEWYVYALLDPKTRAPRYIGWTTDPKRRLSEHILHCGRADSPKKNAWIRSLLREGMLPEMQILESGDLSGGYNESEQLWINVMLQRGEDLTNVSRGGSGKSMECPTEVRSKISLALRGRSRPIDIGKKAASTLRDKIRRYGLSEAQVANRQRLMARRKLPTGFCRACGLPLAKRRNQFCNPRCVGALRRKCGRYLLIGSRQCKCLVCDSLPAGGGYCNKHYKRWKKYGDPMLTRKIGAPTPVIRVSE